MAFQVFNPASLLPSGREVQFAQPPQNDTMGAILGATMENIQRVAKEKRDFDLLISEGNSTADYLDKIDPNLGKMVRDRVSQYAPDPFLGYGAIDAKAERGNLLKGTLEFAKLENDRQSNVAKLAAAGGAGTFNNYQYKLQAAQNSYDAALRDAAQWDKEYAERKEAHKTFSLAHLKTYGKAPAPMAPETNPKLPRVQEAKATLDRFLNMSQSEIVGEATPKSGKVNVMANADGTAKTPAEQVVASSDLPQSPVDTGGASDLLAVKPPIETPTAIQDASVLPTPASTDLKPGDTPTDSQLTATPPAAAPAPGVVPSFNIGGMNLPSVEIPVTGNAVAAAAAPKTENPSTGSPVPGTPSTPETTTALPPGSSTDPIMQAQAMMEEQGKAYRDIQVGRLDGMIKSLTFKKDQITNPDIAEDVKKELIAAKERILKLKGLGTDLWEAGVKNIMLEMQDHIGAVKEKTGEQEAYARDRYSQTVDKYRDRDDNVVDIITRPTNWNSKDHTPTEWKYFYRDPMTAKETEISKTDMEGPDALYFKMDQPSTTEKFVPANKRNQIPGTKPKTFAEINAGT